MTTAEKDLKVIERVEQELLSGRTFALSAASFRSIRGYQPPTSHRNFAAALAVLAEGAALGDRQAALIERILPSLVLHLQGGDMVAKLYDAAHKALTEPYFDTIKNASPEPGRRSDNIHEWTLADRITLKVTLSIAASKIVPTGSKTGWCLDALIERENLSYRIVKEARPS